MYILGLADVPSFTSGSNNDDPLYAEAKTAMCDKDIDIDIDIDIDR